eukprot:4340353-Alexandrium_andersonii.AAC.1
MGHPPSRRMAIPPRSISLSCMAWSKASTISEKRMTVRLPVAPSATRVSWPSDRVGCWSRTALTP